MTRRRQWLQVAFLLAAVVVVIAAMVACTAPASRLASIPPTPSSTTGSAPTPTAVDTPTLATPAAASSPAAVVAPPAAVGHNVTPQRGEGLIALTTRVCGSSRSWTGQAAANHVAGPAYVIYLGQRLDIDCSRTPVVAPAPAPVVVQQAPRQATAEWVNPLPGTCRPSSGGGQFGAPRSGYRHQGIDLGGIEGLSVGTPVRSPHAGIVVRRGYAGNAGNQLQIQSGEWLIKLNHLNGFAVSVGQTVAAGQTVGYMGATGNASGPHLHVELWRSGSLVNPTNVLPVRC